MSKQTSIFVTVIALAVIVSSLLMISPGAFDFSGGGAGAAAAIILIGALILGSFFFYFLPTVIALSRKHQQAAPIVIVNTFLGWTLIGWVVALAWSASEPKK